MDDSERKPGYTTIQIVFLASLIALDFAFGMVAKNLLAPTGITRIIRVDMIVPVLLMMLCRLLLDRWGTLTIYEIAWGLLAVWMMPGAFGLPGFLKLLPAVAQGLAYDTIFSVMRRTPRLRVYVAAVAGGIVGMIVMIALKVAMGLPWQRVTQIVFGVGTLLSVVINVIGAALALVVWHRIADLQLTRRIRATT